MRLDNSNIDEFKKMIDDFFSSKTKEEIQELVDKALRKKGNDYKMDNYYNSKFTISTIYKTKSDISLCKNNTYDESIMHIINTYRLDNNDDLYVFNKENRSIA